MRTPALMPSAAACGLMASVASCLSPYAGPDWASIRCPADAESTLPTPTYGDADAVFTVCAEQLIHAPRGRVYDTLIDFSHYYEWNSFTVAVEVPPGVLTPGGVYVGMPMTLTTSGIVPLINTTSAEVVTVLDEELPTWRSNVTFLGALVTAEHPNILVAQEGGVTRLVSYETYYKNPLIPLLLLARPRLQGLFEQQARDLKAHVESLG